MTKSRSLKNKVDQSMPSATVEGEPIMENQAEQSPVTKAESQRKDIDERYRAGKRLREEMKDQQIQSNNKTIGELQSQISKSLHNIGTLTKHSNDMFEELRKTQKDKDALRMENDELKKEIDKLKKENELWHNAFQQQQQQQQLNLLNQELMATDEATELVRTDQTEMHLISGTERNNMHVC